jgi:PAS domain S-box-containing protein
MNLAEAKDVVILTTGAIGLFTTVGAWLHVRGRNILKKQIEGIQAELTNDSGKSTKDIVNRIEKKLDRVSAGLDFSFALHEKAVWQCDSYGNCTKASPALCEMFGMTEAEMLGFGWMLAIDTQEERSHVSDEWKKAVETRIPWAQSYCIRAKNRVGRIMIESRSYPHFGDDGKATWFYGTCEIKYHFTTEQTLVATAIPGMSKGDAWQTRP